MPMDQKVDYLELPAENLNAVQTFYEAAFNWSFTDYGPEYKAFTDGKIDGGFYLSELKSTVEQGGALIILYASNLEQTEQTVIDSGGEITREIFEFPGGRRFHFADPNGNELAVWSDQ